MTNNSIKIDNLNFSAAHFLVFKESDSCSACPIVENLHGHNFLVNLKLSGELNPNGLVADFISIKKIAISVLNQLNHKLIVPKLNLNLRVIQTKDLIEISSESFFLRLPATSVFLLPHSNSSAEYICEYICTELISAIKINPNHTNDKLELIEVTLTEEPGCSAICEMSF